MRSSGLLCGEYWQFMTDVSGQFIGTIFKGKESKKKTLEDGMDRLSRNVGEKLPRPAA